MKATPRPQSHWVCRKCGAQADWGGSRKWCGACGGGERELFDFVAVQSLPTDDAACVEFMAATIHHAMLDYWHTSQPWDEVSERWREDMRAAVQAALADRSCPSCGSVDFYNVSGSRCCRNCGFYADA